MLVVVTGPPGAGKTTIAEQLRDRLSLPLLAKDTFKETLGEQLGVTARGGLLPAGRRRVRAARRDRA